MNEKRVSLTRGYVPQHFKAYIRCMGSADQIQEISLIGLMQEHDTGNCAYHFTFTAQSSETRFRLVRRDEDGSGQQNIYLDHISLYEIRDTSYNDTLHLATGNGYSYGFNGMLKDDEWNGVGNSYDFGARIYDSRVGKFISVDPKHKSFSDYSPFAYAFNSPILFIDEEGESGRVYRTTSEGKPTLVLKSDIVLYGDVNKEVLESVQREVNSQYNLKTPLKINGQEYKDDNGDFVYESTGQKPYTATVDGVEYVVRFEINVTMEKDLAQSVVDENTDIQKNFIRVVDADPDELRPGIQPVKIDGERISGNTGKLIKKETTSGDKSTSHEVTHILGLGDHPEPRKDYGADQSKAEIGEKRDPRKRKVNGVVVQNIVNGIDFGELNGTGSADIGTLSNIYLNKDGKRNEDSVEKSRQQREKK